MSALDYASQIHTALQELLVGRPECLLVETGDREEISPEPRRLVAPSCDAAAGAALGLAIAGRAPIVRLSPPAAAIAALQKLQPELHAAGPISLVARIAVDGTTVPPGRFATLCAGRIAAPATPADAAALLTRVIAEGGPWLCLEDRRLFPCRERAPHPATGRRGAICRQAGSDVTLVAAGAMVPAALRAARLLLGRGIEAEVVDLRFLAPLDLTTLAGSLQRTHRALVIEEGESPFGPGVAAAITEAAFDELDAPVGVVRIAPGTLTLAETLDRAVPSIIAQASWLLGRSADLAAGG